MIWKYQMPIFSTIVVAGLALPPALAQEERLPLAFVPNSGQWDEAVQFAARRQELTAWLQKDGFGLSLHRHQEDRVHRAVIQLLVEGASPDVILQGEEPLAGRYNFFIGSDPEGWAAGLKGFARVRYCGIHEGVDLLVRNAGNWLEYDLLLHPGADLGRIVFRCEGIEALHLEGDGALVMETASGAIRQLPPVTWQELADGGRRPVECRFRLIDRRHYGFEAEGLEPDHPTVVDPGIEWSTYLGGALQDYICAIAQGDTGLVTVTGPTESPTGYFPTTPGSYDTSFNGGNWESDGFVARLDPRQSGSAQLVWCTYLGGSDSERPNAIQVESSGTVVLTGFTDSSDFPTTPPSFPPPFQPAPNGSRDAFVVRLSACGSQLLYGTYLGGSGSESSAAIEVDPGGVITVAGGTRSTNFQTTPGAYRATLAGGADAYVVRLDPSQSGASQLVYATLIGGSGNDQDVWGLELSTAGEIYLAGRTTSSDFPVTPGAFQTTPGGGSYDAFLLHLDPARSAPNQLCWSTYFGGSLSESVGDLRLDRLNQLTVCGQTASMNLPGARNTHRGNNDGFIARFNPGQSVPAQQLTYCVYIGDRGNESVVGLGVASGVVTVTGWTNSLNFPITPGAVQTTKAAGLDAFVTRIDPNWRNGLQPVYSTFLGGDMLDRPYRSVELDGTDAATVGGATHSTNFHIQNPYQGGNAGQMDGFVTRLDMHPFDPATSRGVQKYGTSTPACLGELAIGVTCMPTSPGPNFGITCTKAPLSSPGLILLGLGPNTGGGLILLAPPVFELPLVVFSDPLGYARLDLPLPPGLRGSQVYCQWLFYNLGVVGCGNPGTFSSSNALNVRI